MKIYDVIVLGGGIMGISIAAKLAKTKNTSVALIEKTTVGNNGATEVSGGFIRVFDFNDAHVQLTLASLETHKKYEKDMQFIRNGHVYIMDADKLADAMPILEMFAKQNYPFEILNSEETAKITNGNIQISTNEIAVWEPEAGYANPQGMAHILKEEFLTDEGILFENHGITDCIEDQEGITTIHTDKGNFRAKSVVFCLGAWNREFLKEKNIHCENKLIELVHAKTAFSPIQERACFNVYNTEMYSKPVSEELQLIGLPQEVYNILPDEERNFGEAFFKKHETLFQSRLQEYTHDDIVNTISSADSYTKQKAPEIQKLQKNWILVNGFNGSGFKMYPAISEYVCKKMI